MEFLKYPSIENLTKAHATAELTRSDKWYAMEKIHGANYQLICDGKNVVAASRNQILSEDDKFFNHKIVFDKYKKPMLDLYWKAAARAYYKKFNYSLKEGDTLRIFGELAGEHEGLAVQNNIRYGTLDFYVFDIFVNDTPISLKYLFEICPDFKTVPIVKIGNFSDIINIENKFTSKIGGLSTCEGLVLKSESGRVYKHKNDLFYENSVGPINVDGYIAYINENRARSVVSKHGEFDKAKMRVYIEDMKEDVKKDMEADGVEAKFDKDFNSCAASSILNVYFYTQQ